MRSLAILLPIMLLNSIVCSYKTGAKPLLKSPPSNSKSQTLKIERSSNKSQPYKLDNKITRQAKSGRKTPYSEIFHPTEDKGRIHNLINHSISLKYGFYNKLINRMTEYLNSTWIVKEIRNHFKMTNREHKYKKSLRGMEDFYLIFYPILVILCVFIIIFLISESLSKANKDNMNSKDNNLGFNIKDEIENNKSYTTMYSSESKGQRLTSYSDCERIAG